MLKPTKEIKQRESKKSCQFLDQWIAELVFLSKHYSCTGSPGYNYFDRELRTGEMLLIRKISWQYHIYN